MAARESVLVLTGRLAEPSLRRELEGLNPCPFDYRVVDIGIKVAALMNVGLIERRLNDAALDGVDRILLPGLCTGPIERLAERYGVRVERGPKDLKDLPEFFGMQGRRTDLDAHSVTIFAEIVDASALSVDAILARAASYRDQGADVIDLGCLPDAPFTHLADAVRELKSSGFSVSVDSLDPDELLRAGQAGADYLLSLKPSTLWVAERVGATPILIPEQPQALEPLIGACEQLERLGRAYFADPILEPLPFGFTASLVRYHALRERLPEAPILMGVGNLTELTDADTTGINALLLGIVAELEIGAILTTAVSPHCHSAIREADLARRMLHAAHQDNRLPRGYTAGLMALRDRKPFPYTDAEITTAARAITDRNYRIQVSEQGIHVYNRDGLWRATEPYSLYTALALDGDTSHAFYLGVELARAQIAWQLGKRYTQDNELDWGCVAMDKQSAVSRHDLNEGYQQRQIGRAPGTDSPTEE